MNIIDIQMRNEIAVANTNETAIAKAQALSELANLADAYASTAKAENTVAAYESDWKDFSAWCDQHGLTAMPATPETIALYITDQAKAHKVSTITRRLASISKAHQAVKFDSPCSMRHAVVAEVFKGIKRQKGTAQTGKAALLTDDIRRLLRVLPDNLLGIRDAALLLLGFAGGFRRSELVALTVADLDFNGDGLTVTIRRSKTDQEGAGRKVGIPFGSTPDTCPVRSVRRWLDHAGITEGPVFRKVDRHGKLGAAAITAQVVRLVVVRTCEEAGLEAEKFAAHSLRSGLATQAAISGASERSIMNQTGHRSVAMVRRYIRDGNLYRENAASKLGL